MRKIIQRGAEAILFIEKLEGKDVLVKDRVEKGYRIPELDKKIRSQRTRSERKLMERARGFGVEIPKARISGDFKITMDYIEGKKLKDVLNEMESKERDRVCKEIGEIVSKLHESGIIHGDLTTSNMILDRKQRINLIDFGLGKFSGKVEDQAVDLFLLYEALKATHYRVLDRCWEKIINTYSQNYSNALDVLKRFEQIKRRRRYKGG